MSRLILAGCLVLAVGGFESPARAAGKIAEVRYNPSSKPGELVFGVTYRVWIPEGLKTVRGVIVHQHGCGKGACQGGETAADDLHWQALARKWDCALLGPVFEQEDQQNCRLWCDPRNGSRARFLQALDDLALKTGHPELARVPWCLWGHSGGGFWASLMIASDPDRVVAAWLRSGTAISAWEKGEIPRPELSDAVYQIPVVCNPGVKENADARFNGAWTGAMAMFKSFREKGAPIAFAPDPRTGHECGESRDLAIPFFDACLAARLPEPGSNSQKLRTLPQSSGYLAVVEGKKAVAAGSFQGETKSAVFLPSEAVARAWEEYVATGTVGDTTPPPAPTSVRQKKTDGNQVELSWEAKADLESGIRGFLIMRDGREIGRVPEKSVPRFGRPLFQGMSYHDTPEKPLAQMKFIDKQPEPGKVHQYQVISINGTGLHSPHSEIAAGR